MEANTMDEGDKTSQQCDVRVGAGKLGSTLYWAQNVKLMLGPNHIQRDNKCLCHKDYFSSETGGE